jgi:Domain of unknown function (DUF4342)
MPAPRVEQFRVSGDELLAKVRELLHEGNVRRIIIRNDKGQTIVEVPLTLGVIGAALLPVLAAVGAIAAIATDCELVVERRDPDVDPVGGGEAERGGGQ